MHQPTLAKKLDELYRLIWGDEFVPSRVKEVARLRSARLVNCGACQNVRLDRPREEGLSEEAVDEINDDYMQSSKLSDQDKAAIMLTDAIVFDPTRLDTATKDAIHAQLSEEQIVELAFEIAKLGAVAKLIITMGMEPDDQYYERVIPAPNQSFGLLGQEVLQGGDVSAPLISRTDGTPFEKLLGRRPNLLAAYRDFYGSLWDEGVLPDTLLELLRLRIAQLHGCASELAIRHAGCDVDDAKLAELDSWQESKTFSVLERAALEYADHIPWSHHQITDEQVEAIKDEIGDAGFVAVSFATAFFDANCRLRQLFELPAGPPVEVDQPASATGPLY